MDFIINYFDENGEGHLFFHDVFLIY